MSLGSGTHVQFLTLIGRYKMLSGVKMSGDGSGETSTCFLALLFLALLEPFDFSNPSPVGSPYVSSFRLFIRRELAFLC